MAEAFGGEGGNVKKRRWRLLILVPLMLIGVATWFEMSEASGQDPPVYRRGYPEGQGLACQKWLRSGLWCQTTAQIDAATNR